MAIFQYKLLDNSGRVVSRVSDFSFDSSAAVYDYFEQLGNTVIYVKPVSAVVVWYYLLQFAIDNHRVKREEVVEFLRSLGVMLKAGVSLLESLVDASEHIANPSLSRVVMDIKISIESGVSFSQALQKHPRLFPESVIYLSRIGEESGLLDDTLINAAGNLQRISRIAVDVKKALIYPAFALLATVAAVVFWLQFTVPNLAELYSMMQVDLPAATQWVIDFSEGLSANYISYITAAVAASFLVAILVNRTPALKYAFDKSLLHMPIVNNIVVYGNMAFIFEYMALLLKSGVDAYSTLGVMANSLRNSVYREAMLQLRDGAARGNSISDEILRNDIFPRYVGRMVKTGETSGTLDRQLSFVADEYQTKLNDIIDRLQSLVEPLAILIIGGFMVVIIIVLFFPIYQLIGSVAGGGGI